MDFDRREIQRAFGRASSHYEQHAWLQQEVRSRLYERLDDIQTEPKRILDLGCGTGAGTAELKQRYHPAQVIGLDFALPMCLECQRQSRWRRPIYTIQGDVAQLPLAANSIDLVVANLVFQWVDDLPAVLNNLRRVLKPGGVLLFSTFGPDTLNELRQAWAVADQLPRISRFVDQHIIGDLLLSIGFRDPVMDCDLITSTYSTVDVLMQDLKAIGAHNANQQRPRGLTGKTKFNAMRQAYERFRDPQSDKLPATWEVVYANAWGPSDGQPLRNPDGGERATFSVDSLRDRLRKKS